MSNSKGYSLPEALAVVGVTMALGLSIVPGLARLRQQPAQKASIQCAANMRAVLDGFKLYVQDWDDQLPPLKAKNDYSYPPGATGFLDALCPYIKSARIFQCPLEPNSVPGKTDFAYNSGVLAGKVYKSIRVPVSTVMLCEAPEMDGKMASASGPIVKDRHQRGSNYGFVDGHVKWLLSTKAPSPTTVAATGKNFTFGR